MKSRVSNLITAAMLVEACLYFYFAYCFANMFRAANATPSQVLTAISGSLLIGLFS